MLDMPILKFEKSTKYLNSQLDIQKNNKQLVLDIIANIGLILNDDSVKDKDNYESVLDSANLFLQTITNNITTIEQLILEINNITKELSDLLAEKNKPSKTKEFYIAAFTNIKQTIVVYSKKMAQLESRLTNDNTDFNNFITENNIKFNFESVESNNETTQDEYKFTGFSMSENVIVLPDQPETPATSDVVEESKEQTTETSDIVEISEEQTIEAPDIVENSEGTSVPDVSENKETVSEGNSETEKLSNTTEESASSKNNDASIDIDVDDLSNIILSQANVEDIVNDYELDIKNERINKLTNEFRNLLVDISKNETEDTTTSAIALFKEVIPDADNINILEETNKANKKSKSIEDLITGVVEESTSYSKYFVNNYPLYSDGLNLNAISTEFNIVPVEPKQEKIEEIEAVQEVVQNEEKDLIENIIAIDEQPIVENPIVQNFVQNITAEEIPTDTIPSVEVPEEKLEPISENNTNEENINNDEEKNESELIVSDVEPTIDSDIESAINSSIEPSTNSNIEEIENETSVETTSEKTSYSQLYNSFYTPLNDANVNKLNESFSSLENSFKEFDNLLSDNNKENNNIDENNENIVENNILENGTSFIQEDYTEPSVLEPENIVEESNESSDITEISEIEDTSINTDSQELDNSLLEDAILEDYLLNELLEENAVLEETVNIETVNVDDNVTTKEHTEETTSSNIIIETTSDELSIDDMIDDDFLEESLFGKIENEDSGNMIIDHKEDTTSPTFFDKKIEKIEEGKFDNETLLISERTEKIYLPYKTSELLNYIHSYPNLYASLSDVVKQEYILPYTYFTEHPTKTRFTEAYNLIRNREGKNFVSATLFALKISKYRNLNPAIVASCKSREELEFYIDCLTNNRLEKFKNFNIAYEVNPI